MKRAYCLVCRRKHLFPLDVLQRELFLDGRLRVHAYVPEVSDTEAPETTVRPGAGTSEGESATE